MTAPFQDHFHNIFRTFLSEKERLRGHSVVLRMEMF